ncbi:MAG: hypothetical protein RR319_08400 [Bacteroides sp.]
MEDFSQYIFIVAIVAIIIVQSIIKARKAAAAIDSNNPDCEPKSTPQVLRNESQSADDWEKWFMEEKNKETKKDQFPNEEGESSFTLRSQSPLKMEETKKTSKPIAHERLGYEPKIKLNTRKEARRAIIYSEILHRKY